MTSPLGGYLQRSSLGFFSVLFDTTVTNSESPHNDEMVHMFMTPNMCPKGQMQT